MQLNPKFKPVRKNKSYTQFLYFIFSILGLLILTSAAPQKDGLAEEVLRYTNQYRESKGLKPLAMREDLNAIARKHSEDMARGRCGFGHSGFEQREQQVERIIIPFNGMAENIVFGAHSGKDAVAMWKNSSGHRRNMLGNYKYIGIGTARNRRGVIYYTEIFVK